MRWEALTPAMANHLDAIAEFAVGLSREEQARFATAVVAVLFIDQSEDTGLKVFRAARALQQGFEADMAKRGRA